MSGRVVQFVVRFVYRFSSDFAGRHGTQKSPQTVQVQGLFGLYRMSWNFQMAERVGFRINHPNSLNFIPVWLRLLHRQYPQNGGLASLQRLAVRAQKGFLTDKKDEHPNNAGCSSSAVLNRNHGKYISNTQ